MERRQGFTLVETMITVAVIGMLASIGVPSISAARNKVFLRTKQANVRLLNNVVQEWSFDAMAGDNSLISDSITNYIKGGMNGLSVGPAHVSLTNITTKTVSHTFTIDDLY